METPRDIAGWCVSLAFAVCLGGVTVLASAQTSDGTQTSGGAQTSGGTQTSGGPQTSGGSRTSGGARTFSSAKPSQGESRSSRTSEKQFEGIIRSQNRSVDYEGRTEEYEMTIWVKNAQIKVTVPRVGATPGSTVIYRTDSRVSWILNDHDRTYFEVAQPTRPGMQEPAPSDDGSPDKPVIKRTGKTMKILGYRCEQVMIQKGETMTEIWGTKDLGDLARVLSQTLQPESGGGEGDLIAKMGLFPLQSTIRQEGRILESQEVTKIERTALSDDLFRIPAGYTRQKALDVE